MFPVSVDVASPFSSFWHTDESNSVKSKNSIFNLTVSRLKNLPRQFSLLTNMNKPSGTTPEPRRKALRGIPQWLLAFALIAFSGPFSGAHAQLSSVSSSGSPVEPLPQDTGEAGLKQELLRLHTTARLLQIDAHPDDEDGGMLTLESRGKGNTVVLMTLNRGEGGQNKVGSNLTDVLGVLRTLEVGAADRYYGIQQRFSRVADFGFSKTADETFQKWGGHDIALADIVRVIRTFQPDVIVSRFSGTPRDGHGNHQAAGILTQEAFRAAADPNRFPEQIKEGLLPWQAKKLYIGNVCRFFASTCPDENWTVKLNTGQDDPALGMSYAQFAVEGLRHQLSQGLGGISLPSGPRYSFYKLVDSTLPSTTDKNGHESDFFAGIDTSLPELATALGKDESKVAWLQSSLAQIAVQFKQAAQNENDPEKTVEPLFVAAQNLNATLARLRSGDLSTAEKNHLLAVLQEKRQQVWNAINLALNISLQVRVVALNAAPGKLPSEQDALTLASPGQKLGVQVTLHNGSSHTLVLWDISQKGFHPWAARDEKLPSRINPGEDYNVLFRSYVPADASYTRPYWHRDNPEEDSLNTIDVPTDATLPFAPRPFGVKVEYSVAKASGEPAAAPAANAPIKHATIEVAAPAMVAFANAKGVQETREFAVAPAFSVQLEPGEQVIPLENKSAATVHVRVTCNLSGQPPGTLRLQAPAGWRIEPASLPVKLSARGESQDFTFKVLPRNLQEGRGAIFASLRIGGKEFHEGYTLVTRDDLASAYYYQPARLRVSVVDVKVSKNLKVAYIMGAGDNIPQVLEQVGMNVTLIPADKLAATDLNQYGSVVLGIRAYDTQPDVAANNKKLLEYVAGGGTLLVQYNADTNNFNRGQFAPYQLDLGRDRVSVEEAPVTILAPADSVFHYPNEITQKDFGGWVQERGLNFAAKWDSHFVPLLASHDPDEPQQKGGMLQAPYGKGIYIYTGYSFFRELPAGVPGAVRLFVNLVSAGHKETQ